MDIIVPKNINRLYNFQYIDKEIDTLVIGDNIKYIDDFTFFGTKINKIYLYTNAEINETCKQELNKNINTVYSLYDIQGVSYLHPDKQLNDWDFIENIESSSSFSNIMLNKSESININSNIVSNNVQLVVSDTNIVDIDNEGNLVAKNPGNTIITVKDETGNTSQITIQVSEEKQEIQLEEFNNSGETPLEYFTYYVYDKYSIITGVAKGHENENVPNLIFPSKINGKPLTQIRIGYGFSGIMVNNFGAFNNWGVRYIKIPDTVELITNQAFWDMNTLERVDLPATSPKYYDECYDTKFLDGIDRDYATTGVFNRCVGLKKVIIPEGWKRIPAQYFCLCKNLEEVTIPDSVEYIGPAAFASCNKLSKFNIPKNLKSYEGFLSLDNLEKQFTELTLPESCISISDNAFAYIYLNKLTIKGRVEIGKSAFRDGLFIELILENGSNNADELSNSDFRYSKCGTLRVPKEEINNYKHLTCFNRILPLENEIELIELIPCTSLEIYESKPITSKIPGSSSSYPRCVLSKGESMNITYTKLPFDTTDVVTFESNKPDFVKVSSNGKVTGIEYLYFDRFDKVNSCAIITVKCGNIERTVNVCVEL